MTPKPLPCDFVIGHVPLTWREALWGYEHQWIDWTCLSDLATNKLSSEDHNKPAEVQLAGMQPVESAEAGTLAQNLANEEPSISEEKTKRKWLYLILRWLFENRSFFSDPLAIVEDLFCDFGHPLEIATFIRYMPPSDDYQPQHHTRAENESRMYENWRSYLDSAERQFGKASVRHNLSQ
jgi:hypothetical protein